MPIRFKIASKRSFSNYDRIKYICSECDNEMSFICALPQRCPDCLSKIDNETERLIKDKDERLNMHLKNE